MKRVYHRGVGEACPAPEGLRQRRGEQGFRVSFANASSLIERLMKANRENKLEERMKALTKFYLLIIDEMGYLPFNSEGLTVSSA